MSYIYIIVYVYKYIYTYIYIYIYNSIYNIYTVDICIVNIVVYIV